MKGVTTLSNNEIYDYATFVREVNRYAEQQRNIVIKKYLKLYKIRLKH